MNTPDTESRLMNLNPSIRKELTFLAGGLILGDILIVAVAILLHRFDYTVVLGAVWGSIFAWLSIFLLALRVQKVADAADETERALAQKKMRSSYFGRIMLMVFAVVIAVVVPFLNYIAALIPFLIPQPVLMLRRSIVTAQDKRAKQTSTQKEADSE